MSGDCKACFLCGKNSVHMTKFSNWKDEPKVFVMRHLITSPPDDALVCKKDLVEAKRYSNDPTYTPKWKCATFPINTENQASSCVFPGCDESTSLIRASFASSFCKYHYNEVYRLMHPPINCASCQAKPKAGGTFRHYCPDRETVCKYLL
jgi:hypothetical protein